MTVIAVLYVLAVEGMVGALLVVQESHSGSYFTASAYARWMLAPLPVEVAVSGPLLAFIAWRHRSLLLRFTLVVAMIFLAVDTLLWLVGFLAWFLVGCGGGLFCHGGPLGY